MADNHKRILTMNQPATSPSSPTETTGGGDASAAPLTSASNTTKPAPASPPTATTNGTASAAAAAATVEPQQQQQQQHDSKPSQSSTDEPQVVSSVSLMNGEIPGSSSNNNKTTGGSLSSSAHNPTPIKPQPTTATPPLPITPDKPEKISRVQSASEIALTAQPKSVTIARKEELLEAARASRLEWIRHVPFPYNVDETNQRNGAVDPLAPLRETHAGRQLPAAMDVLAHLYGFDNNNDNDTAQAAHRIQELLREEAEQGAVRPKEAVPTPEQARKMALANDKDDETNSKHTMAQHNRNLLQSYHLFLQHLAEPAAAMLVQGMRNFCRNLRLKTTTTPQNTDKDQSADNHKSVLIHMLQSYVVSTLDTIRQHELWREDMETAEAMAASRNQSVTDDESLSSSVYMVQRSLQSFLYGQCRAHIDAVCFTTDTQTKEDEWEARVDALQFVTAAHLEVACLQQESVDFVRTLLQEPVAALQSVPAHHAPFEKLQRVLALYRGINAALSQALNQNVDDDDNAETKRLPSADDVLPAIILTVLQARPYKLQYHLQLMEDLLPPEALRGEAGYAFTNLYGAIQFIKDLNLENASDDSPESLNISAHDFQQGLDACRAAAREQMAKKAPNTEEQPSNDSQPRTPISAREIQAARAKGEVVNVEWAVRQQQQKEPTRLDTLLDGGDEDADDEERAATTEPQQPTTTTPSGYKRSYTFLSCQPQDIKVADLPLLLEEYRKMVHTTEELLAERQARVSSEKKQQFSKQYADLHARVQQVDPSLLADHTTSLPKKQPQQGTTTTTTESPSL